MTRLSSRGYRSMPSGKTHSAKPGDQQNGRVLRYSMLLVVLIAVILLEPVVGIEFTLIIFLAAVAVVAALLDGGRRRTQAAVAILGLAAIIVTAFELLPAESPWHPDLLRGGAGYTLRLLVIAALGYCGYLLLKSLIRSRSVSANEILGAISLYLILGIIWSFAYGILELARPGSFAFPSQAEAVQVEDRVRSEGSHELIYFSFVTQSTLGYGDVTPRSPLARRLVIFQAVMGEFYIAVVVAYMISLFIRQRDE